MKLTKPENPVALADHPPPGEAAGRIAEVALNLPLPTTFDYRVGEDEAGRVVPGTRVVVPFGRGMRSGIVVRLKDRPSVAPERLRAIHRVPEPEPLFSPELLEFTRWVASYYLCGWGEVLEAALPAGLGARFRLIYRLRPGAAPEVSAGLSPAIRGWLARHAVWNAAQWERARPGAGERAWLKRQCAPGGAVEVIHEFLGTARAPRPEKVLRVAPGHSPPPAPEEGGRKETRKARVLRLVSEAGELTLARLRAAMPNPWAVVRQLEREGALEVSERAPLPEAEAPPLPLREPFHDLTPDQGRAFAAVREAIQAGGYQAFLLEGVTGSGKTEVYLHAVRETLARGKSALLLVPEIALTAEIVHRFRARFGEGVAVLHSAMDDRARLEAWLAARQGRARIVIGARSALFAPLSDLGLVVVDEEHDPSYKQDETPRYHARDAALVRARLAGATALLGSATPSMESLYNVRQGKLERLELPVRVRNRSLPEVELLDLRTAPRQKGSALFSRRLVEALGQTLARGEQAILFLNRRGFANLVRCESCGEPMVCANCSLSLIYHRAEGRLRCHHCDYALPMPESCPACGAAGLAVVGLGTERIEREMGELFPRARILRMDSDSLRRRGELERMLAGIRERRHDLIIGTQILTKGHDYPHITLVGAVLADVALNLPDFRAAERTFQLLTQMAGRAGRGDAPGRVIVQTYHPSHHALVHVSSHDTARFGEAELAIRAATRTPPFSHQVLLWATSPGAERAERLAREVHRRARALAGEGTTVLGPAEAPIRRINRRYRWMVLFRSPQVAPMHRAVRRLLGDPTLKVAPPDRLVVDVDPHHLL